MARKEVSRRPLRGTPRATIQTLVVWPKPHRFSQKHCAGRSDCNTHDRRVQRRGQPRARSEKLPVQGAASTSS